MTTPLTPDEKRTILERYGALRAAIDGGYAEDDVAARAVAFQRAYIGESRPLVDAFGAADDKGDWARQVRARLAEEIEPDLWPAAASGAAPDNVVSDDAVGGAAAPPEEGVMVVPLACRHCGEVFEVRAAAIPGATLVTEHSLSCPVCGRITEHALAGAVLDVRTPGGEPAA